MDNEANISQSANSAGNAKERAAALIAKDLESLRSARASGNPDFNDDAEADLEESILTALFDYASAALSDGSFESSWLPTLQKVAAVDPVVAADGARLVLHGGLTGK